MGGSTLERIVALLLRPVVRFGLRHALKIQDLTRVLKTVLLEVAQSELAASGKEVNPSQLSACTGIPRKFIPDLLGQSPSFESSGNFITRLIGTWQRDPRFGRGGKPRVLAFEGAKSEFAQLVHALSADLNPYTILFELERVSAVERTAKGLVLKKKLYLEKDSVAGFNITAEDADNLFNAVEANVIGGDTPRNLHLSTYFDNVPDESMSEIREWLLKEGTKFQERVREHLSSFDKDMNSSQRAKSGRNMIRVGSFSFAAPWKKEIRK